MAPPWFLVSQAEAAVAPSLSKAEFNSRVFWFLFQNAHLSHPKSQFQDFRLFVWSDITKEDALASYSFEPKVMDPEMVYHCTTKGVPDV